MSPGQNTRVFGNVSVCDLKRRLSFLVWSYSSSNVHPQEQVILQMEVHDCAARIDDILVRLIKLASCFCFQDVIKGIFGCKEKLMPVESRPAAELMYFISFYFQWHLLCIENMSD